MSEEKRPVTNHKILLEQREKITVTGVTDVISFDEECVICETEMGVVVMKGGGLRVSRLNVDSGDLNIEGEIDSLSYEDARRGGGERKPKSSMFSKIFK